MKMEDDGEKMPICDGEWNCTAVASVVRKGDGGMRECPLEREMDEGRLEDKAGVQFTPSFNQF